MKDDEERRIEWEGRGRRSHFLHNRKCRTAWMATNGILLYTMKKSPNDGGRDPDRMRNRLIGQKNARDNESRCLMVIPPLSAIDDIATRVPDNEWTYCR